MNQASLAKWNRENEIRDLPRWYFRKVVSFIITDKGLPYNSCLPVCVCVNRMHICMCICMCICIRQYLLSASQGWATSLRDLGQRCSSATATRNYSPFSTTRSPALFTFSPGWLTTLSTYPNKLQLTATEKRRKQAKESEKKNCIENSIK